MLYTVHTSFEARDNETGIIRRWSSTEKIEAPERSPQKIIAWRRIKDSCEYSFVTYGNQNARASHRK